MDIDLYQKFTASTVAYPPEHAGDYVTAGLVGEIGELYSAMAKYHRGDYDFGEYEKRAKAEVGDIMWFLARFCDTYGWKLSTLLVENRDKLIDRQNRQMIKGDGDER